MSQAVLLRDDSKLGVAISPDAETLKLSALENAALVGKVTNAAEQEVAVAAQKELRRVLKLCEDARVECKAPVLDYSRRIDDTAKRFKAELDEEESRIVELIADFQALEAARVRAAEALKRLEEERLERERQAELRRVQEEAEAKQRELQKQQDELAAKARAAKNAEQAAEAEKQRLELERQKALAAAESHAELDKINERHCDQMAALPTASAARADGQIVKTDWQIAVTDIWALARSHPMAVKIEPRMKEIRELLDLGVKVAGVTASKVQKPSVRVESRQERKTIEV
jgi:DNA repair exonuclease SbcCD ATPase subunit